VPPHKQNRELTPAEHRVAMLELAIAGTPAFSVCRLEIDRGGVNYTVDSLEHIHHEQPEAELFLLMGADMLADLPNWRRARRVCELALPVAVGRPGCTIQFDGLREIASPERIDQMRRHQVEMPEIGLSATQLRGWVRDGLGIRYCVPSAVEIYIASHGLYLSS